MYSLFSTIKEAFNDDEFDEDEDELFNNKRAIMSLMTKEEEEDAIRSLMKMNWFNYLFVIRRDTTWRARATP